jgi:hypothetical protein
METHPIKRKYLGDSGDGVVDGMEPDRGKPIDGFR